LEKHLNNTQIKPTYLRSVIIKAIRENRVIIDNYKNGNDLALSYLAGKILKSGKVNNKMIDPKFIEYIIKEEVKYE